ncbi:fam-a protein [Plasmodium vinckei brucechwatti]|uniref:Fam-a protein n=1 Tax=Plasmodium vinckei brucechwatti TaxID=119398 RepID=A0A6V7S8C6_PLAVN|nr:fam-a protein [Plasmodium vinckei brucechwatti]
MKVMSVGLISLIIFNIVLAKNNSDSGPITNSSSLFEEKTKKTHKTTEESVNVKGKRPYEENYEDMIKDIFMPLEDSYQYSRNNSHKQDESLPPVSKGPKKQKFTEKRQLSTINKKDKICQKPKDLLCTDPKKDTKTKAKPKKTKEKTKEKTKPEKTKEKTKPEKTKEKTKPEKTCSTPEEIYEENKQLLCTNPNEITNATKLMNEAATHLEHHIKSIEDYEIYARNSCYNRATSIKKYGNIVDQIIIFKYYYAHTYNEIINLLWDPDLANDFNPDSVQRKIVRVYNPNLVMIQQRCKDSKRHNKYFYALAAKVDISKEKTIIVMASANINDQNSKNKDSYKNTIIENANLFTTDIDSESDIKKGKLKKMFVNIAGYLIEKKNDCVNIGYLESINGHASNYSESFIEDALNKYFSLKKTYASCT